MVLQIFESSEDLKDQGDAFNDGVKAGNASAAKTAQWIAETEILSYAFGKQHLASNLREMQIGFQMLTFSK